MGMAKIHRNCLFVNILTQYYMIIKGKRAEKEISFMQRGSE